MKGKFKKAAGPVLTKTARGGHLAYFLGVFIEGHGFYVYAALGLAVVEVLMILIHVNGDHSE